METNTTTTEENNERSKKIQKIYSVMEWYVRYNYSLSWNKERCKIIITDIIRFIKDKKDYENMISVWVISPIIERWDMNKPYLDEQSDSCIDTLIALFFYLT